MRTLLGEAPTDDPRETSAWDDAAAEAGPSEEVGYYVYQTTLTALQKSPDLSQFIDGDSDFMLVSIHGSSTSTFKINIRNSGSKPLYSSAAMAVNVVGTAQLPVRVRPGLYYPAAGKIGIYLEDTSNASNAIELVFTGIRRFKS